MIYKTKLLSLAIVNLSNKDSYSHHKQFMPHDSVEVDLVSESQAEDNFLLWLNMDSNTAIHDMNGRCSQVNHKKKLS